MIRRFLPVCVSEMRVAHPDSRKVLAIAASASTMARVWQINFAIRFQVAVGASIMPDVRAITSVTRSDIVNRRAHAPRITTARLGHIVT